MSLTLLSHSVVSGCLAVQPLAGASFALVESCGSWAGGIVKVQIGTDAVHSCSLTIQDVDFQLPQMTNQSCTGGYSVGSFSGGYTNTDIVINTSATTR